MVPANTRGPGSFLVAMFLLAATMGTAHASSPAWVADLIGKEFILAAAVNPNPLVYGNFADGVLCMQLEGDCFPLREDEHAQVVSAEVRDSGSRLHLEIALTHFGNAEIRIFPATTTPAQLAEPAVEQLLSLITSGSSHRFVADLRSGVLHYGGSNHAPAHADTAHYSSRTSAKAAGAQDCPLCFDEPSLIPGFDEEVQLGQQYARLCFQEYLVLANDPQQGRLQSAADAVSADWPFPMRGFRYRTWTLLSDRLNAWACPGGFVFATTGLLEACENPLELEAVIAHEIAHVEQSHSLRQLQREARNSGIAALLVVLTVGAAAIVTEEPAVLDIGSKVAGLVASTALMIARSGYAKDLEREADFFAACYMERKYGEEGKTAMANILRKSKYDSESTSRAPYSTGMFDTHPSIDFRADMAEGSRIERFDPPLIHTEHTEDEVSIQLQVQGIGRYDDVEWESGDYHTRSELVNSRGVKRAAMVRKPRVILFALASSTNALRKPARIDGVEVYVDGEWKRFDNEEDTVVQPAQQVTLALVRDLTADESLAGLADADFRLDLNQPQESKSLGNRSR